MKWDTDSIAFLFFILFKWIYILKDLSNEHLVRTTSKLRYFVQCCNLLFQNRERIVISNLYKKIVILNLSRVVQL